METTEIQERNKQIALMLDWEQYQNSEERWFGHWKPSNTLASMIEKPWSIRVERLEFDSDWNWLMEAVEFIEKRNYTLIIEDKHCYYYKQFLREAKSGIGKSKKEAVFLAVSDFAKLYNEGKL